ELPDRGQPLFVRIVLRLRVSHRPELQQSEDLAVPSRASLAGEDRPAESEQDCDGDARLHGSGCDESQCSQTAIHGSLGEVVASPPQKQESGIPRQEIGMPRALTAHRSSSSRLSALCSSRATPSTAGTSWIAECV